MDTFSAVSIEVGIRFECRLDLSKLIDSQVLSSRKNSDRFRMLSSSPDRIFLGDDSGFPSSSIDHDYHVFAMHQHLDKLEMRRGHEDIVPGYRIFP